MYLKMKTGLFFLAILLLSLSACSAAPAVNEISEAVVEEAAGEIVVEGAWSRSTPELMDGSGIVYMRITNNGNSSDRLLAAKTEICDVVELHEHVMDSNGVMRMRMIDGGFIEIPAGGDVELAPGGLHLMLVNLDASLKSGTTYSLTLKFEEMGEVTIEVPVFDQEPEK